MRRSEHAVSSPNGHANSELYVPLDAGIRQFTPQLSRKSIAHAPGVYRLVTLDGVPAWSDGAMAISPPRQRKTVSRNDPSASRGPALDRGGLQDTWRGRSSSPSTGMSAITSATPDSETLPETQAESELSRSGCAASRNLRRVVSTCTNLRDH